MLNSERSRLFWPSLILLVGIVGYSGAAVIPAIIPQAVPTANKTASSGTVFQLAASATPGSAGSTICDDGTGQTTTSNCLGSGIYSQAASVTVGNTVTETSVISATGAKGSVTLPANFFSASGVALKIRVWGIHTATANPTIRWQVKIGGTTVLDTGAVVSQTSTNQAYDIDGVITCRTTGTTGTVFGQGKYIEVGNALFPMSNTTTQTINTTISNVVDITVTWGTAAVGDTLTATNVVLQGVFGGAAGGGSGAMTQIAQTILSGTASTFTFSSIPGTYTDLELRVMGRCDIASVTQNVYIQFNGDSGGNYDWQYIDMNNASIGGGSFTGVTQPVIGTAICASSPANVPTAFSVQIHNYAGTTFNKIYESLGPFLRSGTTPGSISLINYGGDWNSTAAVTSLTVGLTAAGNFIAGSTVTLWGIK